jgi:hypothetical protein
MKHARWIFYWLIRVVWILVFLAWLAFAFEHTDPGAPARWLRSFSISEKDVSAGVIFFWVLILFQDWFWPPKPSDKPPFGGLNPWYVQLIVGALIGGVMLLIWVAKWS